MDEISATLSQSLLPLADDTGHVKPLVPQHGDNLQL
jgi:hypothetical protein